MMSTDARTLDPQEMDLGTLKSELLRLPAELREHLAYTLLDSLPTNLDSLAHGIDPELDAAWADEAHRRWQAYRRGEIQAVSEEAFFSDLEARLQR
jgi:putative addiction module component (TIGR02574 family)